MTGKKNLTYAKQGLNPEQSRNLVSIATGAYETFWQLEALFSTIAVLTDDRSSELAKLGAHMCMSIGNLTECCVEEIERAEVAK